MLNTLEITHLILAFVVGSLWVTIITVIAERRGSIVGGVLGGLPSTSAFSFFFIAVNQSTATAVEATTVFPLAFGVTVAYLFFFAFLAQRGFGKGLTLSLLIWFVVSAIIVALGITDFAISLVAGTVISILTYFGFAKALKFQNLEGKQKLYRISDILLRGVGAGCLVFLSVLLSQIGGPVLGGISAAFPAVFTSSLIILNRSRGTEFSRAMTKPLAICGILTIIPYCVAVRFLYPSIGVWFGTLVSYFLVLPLAFLSYRISKK
jgi:uncharacterized membrane protein (GlpM family)